MYYDVVLKSKASFLDRVFTYEYDDILPIGTRVVVPFGNGNTKTLAIVIRVNNENIDFKVKSIIEVLDLNPIVSKELLDLAIFMIDNNISDYSSAINTIFPPGSIDKVYEWYGANEKLLDIDKDLYNFLIEYRSFDEIKSEFGNKYTRIKINNFIKDNLINSYISFRKKASDKYIEYVKLIDYNFRKKIRKNAIKQLKVLEYLENLEYIEKKQLISKFSISSTTFNSLIENNYIELKREKYYRDVLENVEKIKKINLNEEQQKVFDNIINSSDSKFLIYGVTGSGKTEIYLQLVEYYINQRKEAIILVPEISLTPQTIERFQGRFGKNIAVLHSKLSISERADQWNKIKNREVKIVIGARSAIFAPFENLGIIVIDEEHESSYISEKNPKYFALEIAKKRLEYHNAKLVLGTATPSISTMYDINLGNIKLLKLEKRVNNLLLPKIEVVDMREELKKNNLTMFSNSLQDKIKEALNNKEQIILFLNKRGHTSFVFCRSCGYVHKCDACDVAMTYHKNKDRLICHYCGRTALKLRRCPRCGSKWIKEYGAGTEMLEEQTLELFPNARVFRMDADTTTTRKDYYEVYNKMNNNEIDILIGTQMLAKGLDFSNVSLVGIISADVGLNIPDYRASEKTFSLLTQVSGRSGRSKKQGNVVIQTYNPSHYAIKNVSNNNYYEFYSKELLERKKFNYPPIVKILNINISSKDRNYAINFSKNIMLNINNFLRENSTKLIELTGPTPSIIEKINNYYKFDIILKSNNRKDLINIANYIRNNKDNKVYINYKLEEV